MKNNSKLYQVLSNPRSAVNICFIIVLLFVGLLLNNRIKTLLYRFTEGQVARQAETIAEKTSEEFLTEAVSLGYRAEIIQQNPDRLDKVFEAMSNANGNMILGLVANDGSLVAGEALPQNEMARLQPSFRGNKVVNYIDGLGMLFSCPVYQSENIKYVLYEICPQDKLGERFSVSCFDGMGKALVISRDESIIVPFENATQEDIEFFYGAEISAVYGDLLAGLETSASAAKFVNTPRGDHYVFASEIPETDFYLSGFVESEVAAEGAYSIVLLVGRVFELITLLFTIGSVYLIITSGKIRENDELIRAKQIAEEASRAKSDFLANMSHEIRTPINAILGMDELIIREYDDQTLRQYALNIRNAGNTLLTIINDILDFSKIESGKMQLVPVEYDTALLIYDLVNMIRPRAEKKDLTFIVRADDHIPRTLFGDNIRLKQCVLNILTNAVKYTETGSVTLTFEYSIVDLNYIDLRVSVKDTGIGIKQEDIDKLFTPFERMDEIRNRGIEGTGLGISIVTRLLALMGSTLELNSEYGKGSDFFFSAISVRWAAMSHRSFRTLSRSMNIMSSLPRLRQEYLSLTISR